MKENLKFTFLIILIGLGLGFGIGILTIGAPEATIIGKNVSVSGNLGVGTLAPESGSGKVVLKGDTLPFITFDRKENPQTSELFHIGVSQDTLVFYKGENTLTGLLGITKEGKVGIGVLPQYSLDIAGDIRFTGTLQGGSVPWQRLTSFPSACPQGQFVTGVSSTLTCQAPSGISGSGTANYLPIWNSATSLTSSVIYQTADAKIGIGTPNPTQKLHIYGDSGSQRIRIESSGTSSNDQASLQLVAGGKSWISWVSGDSDQLKFFSSSLNSNLLVLDSAGYVGISKVNPEYKLDVSGDINIGGNSVYRIGGTPGISLSCNTGETPSGITISGGIVTSGGSCLTIGTITGVTPGTGLTGGGTSGNVTLSADTNYLQRRVTGTCQAGNAIRVINADGTVTCEPIPQGTVKGSGTATRIAFWSAADTLTSDADLFWDAGNKRLGIGTTTPAYKLDVSGDIRFTGTLQGGSVPWQRLTSFPSACPQGQFVTGVSSTLTCQTPPGGLSGSGTANYLPLWTGGTSLSNSILYQTTDAKIGIGTTTPGGKLEVAGEVIAQGFYYSSDIALKKDIQNLDSKEILEKVRKLQGVSFVWKDSDEKSIGLIAQEVEKIFPEVVFQNPKTGIKSVDYAKLVTALIEAIKAQQEEIESLKEK